MNGGKVVYIGEHTPWPSYIAVTRERGYPESRRYYQRETCRMVHAFEYVECKVDLFECSECDWSGAIDDMTAQVHSPRFCPNCGRKVVEG